MVPIQNNTTEDKKTCRYASWEGGSPLPLTAKDNINLSKYVLGLKGQYYVWLSLVELKFPVETDA